MTKDEALKLALDWFMCYADGSMSRNNAENLADEIVDDIKAALAQPAPESLNWLTVVYKDIKPGKEAEALILHPKMSAASWSHALNDRDAALTTQPAPQRTWVGLTPERIKEIWLNGKDHGDDWADVLSLARAFEDEIKRENT